MHPERLVELKQWYVYLVRCRDDSLYCGVTTDLERRVSQHNAGAGGQGARYTHSRGPVRLAWSCKASSRSEAGKLETAFKRLRRPTKEQLILGYWPESIPRPL